MDTEPAKVSAAAIAQTNDRLRKMLPHLPFPHRCVLTDEIASLAEEKLFKVISNVKNQNNFNEDNDPYGEHDFGSIDFEGQKIFWKFDYFDPELKYYEENGIRVLTIMFAHEY